MPQRGTERAPHVEHLAAGGVGQDDRAPRLLRLPHTRGLGVEPRQVTGGHARRVAEHLQGPRVPLQLAIEGDGHRANPLEEARLEGLALLAPEDDAHDGREGQHRQHGAEDEQE